MSHISHLLASFFYLNYACCHKYYYSNNYPNCTVLGSVMVFPIYPMAFVNAISKIIMVAVIPSVTTFVVLFLSFFHYFYPFLSPPTYLFFSFLFSSRSPVSFFQVRIFICTLLLLSFLLSRSQMLSISSLRARRCAQECISPFRSLPSC